MQYQGKQNKHMSIMWVANIILSGQRIARAYALFWHTGMAAVAASGERLTNIFVFGYQSNKGMLSVPQAFFVFRFKSCCSKIEPTSDDTACKK